MEKHGKGKAVLVIGATGSIGSLVVKEALRQGFAVRALVRSSAKAESLPEGVEAIVGDLTKPATLANAVEGADAVIFTHGSDGGGKVGARTVDYGGVHNVLTALGKNRARIALMTAIGVTNRIGSYNRETESHDWKRRAERLVRRSGNEYTIVRPGWFDYNKADEHQLVFLQGDARQAGNSSDGVIARHQIAEVLVDSVTSAAANRKTFELIAEKGAAPVSLEPLFSSLEADPEGALDAVRDANNQPLEAEPAEVNSELQAFPMQ